MKNNYVKKLFTTVDKHIPEVLITIGVAGVFVTAFLAASGTVNALEHIQDAKDDKFDKTGDSKLTPQETVQACAMDFAPAGAAAVITSLCIGCAYSDKAREAALFAGGYEGMVYALRDERGLTAKLKEALGPKKSKEAEEEYAIEQANAMQESPRDTLPIVGKGTHVFKDVVQQREFVSDYESVRAAFNTFCERILEDPFSNGVSWNDLNELLGIPESDICDMWVYTTDDLPIKPIIGTTFDTSGNPCFSLKYPLPTQLA